MDGANVEIQAKVYCWMEKMRKFKIFVIKSNL